MGRRELPAAIAALSAAILVLLMYLGSRGFKDFDAEYEGGAPSRHHARFYRPPSPTRMGENAAQPLASRV